jgi:hypothetical protein
VAEPSAVSRAALYFYCFFANLVYLTAMKLPLLLLCIILAFFQCSTNRIQESSSADSTSLSDSPTADLEPEDDSNEEDTFSEEGDDNSDTLAFALEAVIDDEANNASESAVYSLSASFSGYENSADAMYYYDSALALKYSVVTWASEGTSGSYTYYFQDGNVIAGREENAYNDYEEIVLIHTRFKPTYGLSKTNGTENDSQPSYLGEADYVSKNADAINEYERLIGRIAKYQDSVSYEGDFITLHLENVVNYGEDFTETENFRISKPVFERLIKQ